MKKRVMLYTALSVLALSPVVAFANTTSTNTSIGFADNTSTSELTSSNPTPPAYLQPIISSTSNTASNSIGESQSVNSNVPGSTVMPTNASLSDLQLQSIIAGLSVQAPQSTLGNISTSSSSTTPQTPDQVSVSESQGHITTTFTHSSVSGTTLQQEFDAIAGAPSFTGKMEVTDTSTGSNTIVADKAAIQKIVDAMIQQGTAQYISKGSITGADSNTFSHESDRAVIGVPAGNLTLTFTVSRNQTGEVLHNQSDMIGMFNLAEGTQSYYGVLQGVLNVSEVSKNALSPSVSKTHKSIELKGKVVSSVPSITYDGTTYMPVWYVMQVIKQFGYQNTWDGQHWNIEGRLPDGTTVKTLNSTSSTTDSVEVNGQPVANVDGISYQGTTYMPVWYVMQALKNVGVKSSWDGTHWNLTH